MSAHYFKTNIVLACIFLLLALSGCKKGEDDPAFTLATRKSRMSGDWKMRSGKLSVGVKTPSVAQPGITYEFEEKEYSSTNGQGGHFNGTSVLSISFKKSGAFSIKQTIDSLSFQATGTWDFEGKIGKYKNKEQVIIRLLDIDGKSNFLDLFNKSSSTFTYHIKELRKNKLVLTCDDEFLSLDQTGTGYYATAEYVFTQY